mgnify:CR=1 FL=1
MSKIENTLLRLLTTEGFIPENGTPLVNSLLIQTQLESVNELLESNLTPEELESSDDAIINQDIAQLVDSIQARVSK